MSYLENKYKNYCEYLANKVNTDLEHGLINERQAHHLYLSDETKLAFEKELVNSQMMKTNVSLVIDTKTNSDKL